MPPGVRKSGQSYLGGRSGNGPARESGRNGRGIREVKYPRVKNCKNKSEKSIPSDTPFSQSRECSCVREIPREACSAVKKRCVEARVREEIVRFRGVDERQVGFQNASPTTFGLRNTAVAHKSVILLLDEVRLSNVR